MRDLCLDEGILQSYYDGQLEPKLHEQVISHLLLCSSCADVARQVESEIELTTIAFAAEMALSVPSERLRSRLDEAIAGMNVQTRLSDAAATSRLRGWLVSFASSFNLSPQQAIGFASILIFFVLAGVVGIIIMRQSASSTGLALVNDNQRAYADLPFADRVDEPEDSNTGEIAKQISSRRRVRARSNDIATDNQIQGAHRMLPGEKNYLQAISLLTDAIEANGETSLKPTLLADYKRNLEVVNQAITATQRTARTNPKSPDAAEMLFVVYQSKLDLLSAVAEQSKPMIAQR